MATSSEKGTVIRIFSIPDGKKLFQFRRGSMPARIYSMSFNAASTLLCVSSATETVHIFKLSAPQHNRTTTGLRPSHHPHRQTKPHRPRPGRETAASALQHQRTRAKALTSSRRKILPQEPELAGQISCRSCAARRKMSVRRWCRALQATCHLQ